MIGFKRPPPRKGSTTTTSMYAMFNHAVVFNGDLSAWNVARGTSMSFMFGGCPARKPSWYH